MRAILRQAGHQEENLPPPAKKVKADHGEIMQKITDHYTSRGHYVAYGSVNTASTSCTKNIQTNKYPLCMRRFSGYKRSCFSTLSPVNSLTSTSPTKPQSIFEGATVVNIKSIPHQAADKSLISSAPVLSRLLDDQGLADSKSSKLSQPGHPLALEPTQGETPQQQDAPLLVELLEGPEGANAEKRLKKIQARQKRRTTSETSTSPGSAGSTPTTTAVSAARKRKKSDNEEIVRELTSKVKSEVSEQQQQHLQQLGSASLKQLSGNISPVVRIKADLSASVISSGGQTLSRPPVTKQSSLTSSQDSALVQLLTDVSTDRKPTIKTEVVTVADLFDSPTQMKQEAETKNIVTTGKVGRPRKSVDDKKVKHSASSDGSSKPKKLKKTESSDSLKSKESKSMDAASFLSKSTGDKPKVKLQIKNESMPSLSLKTMEDRASPKEKVKKQSSEKEKKKKTPKSPSAGEPSAKGHVKPAAQDLMKLGFYGAHSASLKSLPKIPKRKPGDNQSSPTSETPPPIAQKSPVPTEWQKASPIPNRSAPSVKSSASAASTDDQTFLSINRGKLPHTGQPSASDGMPKKLPLLPTPKIPPLNVEGHSQSPQPILQRKSSLNDVINRLNHPTIASYTSSNAAASTSWFQPPHKPESAQRVIEPSPNSPDELSVIESHPVRVPLIQSAESQLEIAPPDSPTPEIITQAPKSIPLAATPKPILVKQKAVNRPLTYSPNPSREDGVGVGL